MKTLAEYKKAIDACIDDPSKRAEAERAFREAKRSLVVASLSAVTASLDGLSRGGASTLTMSELTGLVEDALLAAQRAVGVAFDEEGFHVVGQALLRQIMAGAERVKIPVEVM